MGPVTVLPPIFRWGNCRFCRRAVRTTNMKVALPELIVAPECLEKLSWHPCVFFRPATPCVFLARHPVCFLGPPPCVFFCPATLAWHESFFQRYDNIKTPLPGISTKTSSRIAFYSMEHKSCSAEHAQNAGKTTLCRPEHESGSGGTRPKCRRDSRLGLFPAPF